DPGAAAARASGGDRAAPEGLRRPVFPEGRQAIRDDRPPVDPPLRGVSLARERAGTGESRRAFRDSLPGAGVLPQSLCAGRVGAGPAGLGGAIRLAQRAKAAGKTLNITVIEKDKEVGAHTCSGAVMDPKALRELLPDVVAQGAPIEGPFEDDLMYLLLKEEAI